MARKEKFDAAWAESPEWKSKVEKVNSLKKAGYQESIIATILDAPPMEVIRIVEDEERTKALAKKNYEEKIPVMKEIVGMGLEAINKTLREIICDDDKRQKLLKDIGSIVAMKNLVKDLEMLVRLSEDKSTGNIAVAYKHDTQATIEHLKKIDPVFDYTEETIKSE